MKCSLLFFTFFALTTANCETWTGIGVSAGSTSSGAFRSANISWTWLTPLQFAQWLKAGAGARYTYIGKNGEVDLGPSRTWSASDVSIGAANIMVAVEASLNKDIAIGMNLDLAGFSHGRSATLRSGPASDSGTPRSANVFLIAKRDRGTLNSEFYLSYKLTSGQRLSAGLSHQVIEYEAAISPEKLQRFYNLGFIRFQF